jgi:hypothetical protein
MHALSLWAMERRSCQHIMSTEEGAIARVEDKKNSRTQTLQALELINVLRFCKGRVITDRDNAK